MLDAILSDMLFVADLKMALMITIPLCFAACCIPCVLYWVWFNSIEGSDLIEEKLLPESDGGGLLPKNENQFTKNFGKGAIGMYFTCKEGQMQVLTVSESGQCKQAGVQVGDIIVAVDKYEILPADSEEKVRTMIKKAKRPMVITFERAWTQV